MAKSDIDKDFIQMGLNIMNRNSYKLVWNPMFDMEEIKDDNIIYKGHMDNMMIMSSYMKENNSSRHIDITDDIDFIPYNEVLDNFMREISSKKEEKQFIENELYTIEKYDEDIPIDKQIYRLIKFLKPNEYILSDTLVMKLVEGPNNGIYSLTKMDCKLLNIPYESGLQLFSTNHRWKLEKQVEQENKVNETKYFNINNNKIHMYFKLKSFIVHQRKNVCSAYDMSINFPIDNINRILKVKYNGKIIYYDVMLNDLPNDNSKNIVSELIIHATINIDKDFRLGDKKMLNVSLSL